MRLPYENVKFRSITKYRIKITWPTLSQMKSVDPQVRQLPLAVCHNYLPQSGREISAFQKQVQYQWYIWNKNIRPLDSGCIYQKGGK